MESEQATPVDSIKDIVSKFCEGSQVRQTPEEGWRTYHPKHCGNNNKDEDNNCDNKWVLLNRNNYLKPYNYFIRSLYLKPYNCVQIICIQNTQYQIIACKKILNNYTKR